MNNPTKEFKSEYTSGILDKYRNVEFSPDIFPDIIKDVCDHLHEVQGTPPEMLYFCAVAIVAGVAGSKYEVKNAFRAHTQSLNQYMVGVGHSSCGKTTALKKLLEPINNIERRDFEKFKQNKAQGVESADPRFIVRDATKEGLIRRMEKTNAPLFAISDEARGVFDVINGTYKKQGTEYSFYNTAWSGEPYSVDRSAQEPVYIPNAYLSSLWLTQPDAFAGITRTKEQLENGFLQRLLLFKSDIKFKRCEDGEPAVNDNIISKWNNLILRLYENRTAQGISTITATPNARNVFKNYFNSFEGMANNAPDAYGYLSKATEKACRLAGVFALCSKTENIIDQKTAENACSVIDYSNSILLEYIESGLIQKDNLLREKIFEVFRRNNNRSLSAGIFRQQKGIPADELERAARKFPNDFSIEDGRQQGSKILTWKTNN